MFCNYKLLVYNSLTLVYLSRNRQKIVKNKLLKSSEPILKIIRSINSKCIDAVLDPVNMLILQQRFLGKIIEWSLESFYKMGDDDHTHLFDYNISDRQVSNADPSDGDLNLKEFLSRLKSIGYSGKHQDRIQERV